MIYGSLGCGQYAKKWLLLSQGVFVVFYGWFAAFRATKPAQPEQLHKMSAIETWTMRSGSMGIGLDIGINNDIIKLWQP